VQSNLYGSAKDRDVWGRDANFGAVNHCVND
jgi:hypothetical protein